jgi:hypothetical protein
MDQLPISIDDLCRMVTAKSPKEGPLTHLGEAVSLAGDLNALADQLIGRFVDEARDSGASWTEIGDRLGVTKQAAQKRFVTRRASSLFTRFGNEARSMVMSSVALAQEAGAARVGTEHLVLAMIVGDDSPATQALASVGASIEEVRSEARSVIGASDSASPGHVPFSADAKKTLELALREAIRRGDRRIESQHILLGLMRDPKSPGARILVEHGLTHAKVEDWLVAGSPGE